MKIQLNGKPEEFTDGLSVAALLQKLEIEGGAVAVELNLDIVSRDKRAATFLKDGDEVEIVKFIGGGSPEAGDLHSPARAGLAGGQAAQDGDIDTPLIIDGEAFSSRLLLGTGRYPSFDHMRRCHEASGTEIVTVAVARHELGTASADSVLDYIDRKRIQLLPNTAGAYTAREAVRLAKLARDVLQTDWIKLEVLGNSSTLWPDVTETVAACRELVRDGFKVLPYTTDDPLVARRLEDEGAVAVMPLGSMIGSGLGVLNPFNIQLIKANAKVPVVVDAGVGTASDAAAAMELGADAVLLNTAVAQAQDPIAMALAMGLAVKAGRLAFLAGRIPKRSYATASSQGAGLSGQK